MNNNYDDDDDDDDDNDNDDDDEVRGHLGPVLLCLTQSLPPFQPGPVVAGVGGAQHDQRPPAGRHVGDDLVRDGEAGQEVSGVATAGEGGAGGGGGRLQSWPQLILHPGGLRVTVGQEDVVLHQRSSSQVSQQSFVIKAREFEKTFSLSLRPLFFYL